MEGYLDTRGLAYIGIGICDRCSRKFPIVDLHRDPNFPGLRVCAADLDVPDPWREPAPAPEVISLRFPRPDVGLE
jgi:hypothetical protein